MQELNIEEYIDRELSSEEQKTAIEFVRSLRDKMAIAVPVAVEDIK